MANNKSLQATPVRKDVCNRAMILAAGKGTRLRPLTDTLPKALVEVGGVPLIVLQMNKLKSFGFSDITVNVHHFADMLENYIFNHIPEGVEVSVSSERAKLLNTGGALKKAKNILLKDNYKAPILIHNVDILSNADLKEFCEKASNYDAALLVSKRDSSRQLYFNPETMRLTGWHNLKTGEWRSPYADFKAEENVHYAFSGIHALSRRSFEAMDKWPDEFSIIDFYLKESVKLDIRGIVCEDLKLLDIGKLDTLAKANDFLNDL